MNTEMIPKSNLTKKQLFPQLLENETDIVPCATEQVIDSVALIA